MKLTRINWSRRRLRVLAIAAAPIMVAGVIIGPTAGTALALEPPGSTPCFQLLNIAYEYWSEATSYQLGADAALERGDLQAWAEDNTLDDYYSDLGDGAYDQWTGQGCLPQASKRRVPSGAARLCGPRGSGAQFSATRLESSMSSGLYFVPPAYRSAVMATGVMSGAPCPRTGTGSPWRQAGQTGSRIPLWGRSLRRQQRSDCG